MDPEPGGDPGRDDERTGDGVTTEESGIVLEQVDGEDAQDEPSIGFQGVEVDGAIGLGISKGSDADDKGHPIKPDPITPEPQSPPLPRIISSPSEGPSLPNSPNFVPFKVKRSSVTTLSLSPPLNGTTSPPPSAFLSPTAFSPPNDWPSSSSPPDGFDPNVRRTSVVFGGSVTVPSPRKASLPKNTTEVDQPGARTSSSGSPVPFESVTLSDDKDTDQADGPESSPFVYASPAVAHSTREKRASWSHPVSQGTPPGRSSTPRMSAATEGSDGGDKPGRPVNWLNRGTSSTSVTTEVTDGRSGHGSRTSESLEHTVGVKTIRDNGQDYDEPEANQAIPNGSSSKPRIHAPPAIPHSANPAIARAMSPSNASGQSSLGSTSSGAVEKPKRKFVLYRIHGKEKEESNGIKAAPPRRPTPHNATAGPSKLEQVRSHTRPIFLPPKPKEEDEKHLKDWGDIMDAARQAEFKREAVLEKARLEKEARMAESLPAWEALLADDKSNLREKVDADPKLRAMWFEGVPSHMRGKLWSRCIGNPLAMSKDSFTSYNARAQRAVRSGRFPLDVLERIEHDSATTLPATKLFQAGSPMQEELKDLLLAWFVSRFDEGANYMSNVHHIAGMLLLTMNLSLAFVALRNLLDRPCLRAFYCNFSDEVEAYYRIFDNLQGESFPKIYANCKHLGVRLPSSYFTTLFLHQLSYETANRVWDLIMLHGDGHVFRVALGILAILEPRLYFPDRKEITSVLEGNNPASLAIIARERERAKQRGQLVSSATDGVLTALGVNESTLFEALATDNWKEARFDRLSQRELPD